MIKKAFYYIENFAQIIIAIFLYGVIQQFYFFPRKFNWPAKSIIFALITVIVLAIIFEMYKHQLKKVNYWGFNQTPHWSRKRFLIAIVGILLIVLLGAIVLRLVSGGKTISTNQQTLNQIAKNSGQLFKIMVVFIAPFCEETIFRGMFFNTFFTKKTTFNKWGGILASGFMFAYMHDPYITKFILVYWVLGCVLAWVYISTKDLRYSMLVHMCYNALGVI